MRKQAVRRAAGAGLSALAVVATMTMSAGSASADIPLDGQLCTAQENIQFYTAVNGAQSYTVQAGSFIRVQQVQDSRWAYGHGTNHSDRFFIYKHADGTHRLGACHFT
jgi:hypothetical protein